MPGDPKECRKQAENCLRLAKTAQTSEFATQLERLAQSWLHIADDLEKAEAYLVKLHAGKKEAG